MRLYNIGALIKILVGISILSILYNYVNVYQDPAIGISFGFLGVFMLVWGIGYFLFLLSYKLFSQEYVHKQASLSYKLSLMLGMYVMVNLTLIITQNWNRFIGFLIIVLFIVVHTVFGNDKKKEISY